FMQPVQFVRDSHALIFPELCIGCNQVLDYQENHPSTNYIYVFPKTNYDIANDNLATKQLMGHLPFSTVSQLLYFTSGRNAQRIIHHIKYKDGFAAAEWLGVFYGHQLKNSALFSTNIKEALDEPSVCSDWEVIIPVPLHKKRLRSRGYNQSDYLAKGLSKAL